jgi:hypothetical protein
MGGYFTAGIEFTDIDVAGVSTRFFATPESAAPIPGFQMELETTSTIHGRTNRVVSERIRASTLPGVGTFFMRGAHFEVPKGWKTVWKTQALK